MQFFDISVGINDGDTIYASGKYIYFLEGSAGGADATIAVSRGNSTAYIKPGQAVRLDGTNEYDTRWILSNHKKQAPILGYVLIADAGEFTDNRISGSVEVIDGGKARTMANIAFFERVSCFAPAGFWPTGQLWNPPGSGYNMIVEQLFVNSGHAQNIGLHYQTVALLTQSAVLTSKKSNGGAVPGGMTSRIDTPNAAPAGGFFFSSIPAGAMFPVPLREPIIITPGYGLGIFGDAANTLINMMAEGFVEAV